MGGVGRGLDVGDVQAQGVANVELDLVGRLVAAHDGHVDVDLGAVDLDALVAGVGGELGRMLPPRSRRFHSTNPGGSQMNKRRG